MNCNTGTWKMTVINKTKLGNPKYANRCKNQLN